MAICNFKGCTSEGRWHPVLELRHESRPGPGAHAGMGLLLCDGHRAVCKLDDVLTDEGFQIIADSFSAAGQMRPTRRLTTLGWQSDEEYWAMMNQTGKAFS